MKKIYYKNDYPIKEKQNNLKGSNWYNPKQVYNIQCIVVKKQIEFSTWNGIRINFNKE